MIGLSIGSGEMILWPWITARFGADMVWAAALGVFIQLWLNFETGRWAIATGESIFTGYARWSKLPIYYFMKNPGRQDRGTHRVSKSRFHSGDSQ